MVWIGDFQTRKGHLRVDFHARKDSLQPGLVWPYLGQGHCETDADCERPGWARCGDNLCLNSQYFPVSRVGNIFSREIFQKYFQYPNNTAWFGFSSSDNCCYRYCNKLYRVCSNGEVGCRYDDDCVAGVVCDTSLDQPKCVDIDECQIDNLKFNGTAYCGQDAFCTNNVGSFSCSCDPGYTQHTPWDGCRDINECTEGGHNCKQNTDCHNLIGRVEHSHWSRDIEILQSNWLR